MLSAKFQIVRRGLHLDVNIRMTGRVLGLVGPSGCGKTTLLGALAGLVRPTAGSIALDGRVVFDQGRAVNVPPHRRRVGLAFQDHRLWPHLSVRGNLRYARKRAATGAPRFSIEQVADWLGLRGLLSRRVGNLSGGEAQRVALGRAVLCHPRLLLLDEPLAGLDPERSERTLAMLARLIHHTQVPTIIVSHHHAQLLRLTDQVAAVSSDSTVRHDDTAGPVDNCSLAGLAVNRLPLRVASHHPAQGITRLTLAHSSDRSKQTSRSHRAMGNPLAPVTIAATYSPGLPVGRPVVGLLESQQIVLSLAPVETVSMQNRLRGRIHAMRSAGSAVRCGVELDVGGRCMVTITPQAAADFQLHAGMVIWCLFKATALTVAEDLSQASLASTLQPRQEEVDRPVDTATTGRALPPAVTAT